MKLKLQIKKEIEISLVPATRKEEISLCATTCRLSLINKVSNWDF